MKVIKEVMFEAAHYLPNYDGPCSKLHGHSYKLQIEIMGPVNPKTGMVIDFKVLKDLINEYVLSLVDHSYLNNIKVDDILKITTDKEIDKSFKYTEFPSDMPTAENLAKWIYSMITVALIQKGITEIYKNDQLSLTYIPSKSTYVSCIRLWETTTSYVEYTPSDFNDDNKPSNSWTNLGMEL